MTAKIRCPKCGSCNFTAVETVSVADWIIIKDGEAIERGHGDWSDFLGMNGECGCGHRWRLRTATSDKICDQLARNVQ